MSSTKYPHVVGAAPCAARAMHGLAPTLVIAAWLCTPIQPVAAETLKYGAHFVPSPAAIEQSNQFAIGEEMVEPLKDGWQHEGFKVIIDPQGRFGELYSSSLVVDRKQDPVLRETIERARNNFGALAPRPKAEALTHFAHDAFSPPGTSDDDLSDWDDSFGNQHRGERLLLGEYLAQKKGVCEQQAVLLKVLADELNLPATLIFGFDGNTGHVWTTIKIDGKELVYDAAQEITGTAPGDLPHHKSIRELYGADFDKLVEVITAHDLLARDDYAAAETSLKIIAALDEKALGSKHPAYAISLERIAELYKQQEQYEKAEPYLEKALNVFRKAWGRHHQEVADCLNNLANLESKLGNLSLSERLFKKSIAIYERTLGKDDASVADPLYNLADLYEDQGRYQCAKKLFSRALAIYEKTKGPNNEDTIDAKNKLNELAGRL